MKEVTGAMLRKSNYRLAKRLWRLVDVLQVPHVAVEVAAAIDVSRATVYRYLDWLEVMGVVLSRTRVGGVVLLGIQTPRHHVAQLLARSLVRDIAPDLAKHLVPRLENQ